MNKIPDSVYDEIKRLNSKIKKYKIWIQEEETTLQQLKEIWNMK